MAAPRSERFAPHYKSQTTQRTWRWLIRNKATQNLSSWNKRIGRAQRIDRFTLLAHLSTGHFRLDLKRDMRTPDAPSGRSTGIAYGHDSSGSGFFVHHGTTQNNDKNCVVTHIEPSWYQRSLPINHYYHRRLIGLALCYCRFVHLYCYIRTACRGPETSVLNSPLERVNHGAHRSMHISRNLIRTNSSYWCTNDEANENTNDTANECTNNCPNECVTGSTNDTTNGSTITNISIIKTPRTAHSKRTIQSRINFITSIRIQYVTFACW